MVSGFLLAAGASAVLGGCLDREVATDNPTVKTNYQQTVKQTAVDQVDILFMIDNSTSMGDKQKLLAEAVPNLVQALVQPHCLDSHGNNAVNTDGTAILVDPTTFTCPTGDQPEFAPVHDMHLGIVSSSIGDFGVSEGGDNNTAYWVCPARDYTDGNADGGTLHIGNDSENDHAQLLNRTTGIVNPDMEATTDADPDNYLSWFPTVQTNAGKTMPLHPVTEVATLGTDFSSLVTGVQQFGCGYEGQLESWYQFLIQPDPWASIIVDGNGKSQFVGINKTVLQQRRDFLRPESLVAVIAISDEDDSTVDPGGFNSTAWVFENANPSHHLPLPTNACATQPDSGACTSCSLVDLASHPECKAEDGGLAEYPTGTDPDNPNVRFALPRERFGIDPQYPISRYLNGLVGRNVPDRSHETHDPATGRYDGANLNCTNPLYATSLADPTKLQGDETTATLSPADQTLLCGLSGGTGRDPSLVFFGFIGGVPWQMLTHDPANASTDAGVSFISQSGTDDISEDTWTELIGADPQNYDYSGQSPYMTVSINPRPGLQPPTASSTADPFNGREHVTNGKDLQYACTFALPNSLDCSATAIAADMAGSPPYDGLLSSICDCDNGNNGPGPSTEPLCDPSTTTTQTRGKAYPGIREFTLVHAMDQQLAKNGIAASICPRYSQVADQSNPEYGYNPAVQAIVAKLKNALGNSCVPRALTLDANGLAPCSVIELLPDQGDTCAAHAGLTNTDPAVAKRFTDTLSQGNGDAGTDFSKYTVCTVAALPEGCAGSSAAGWCYETKADDPTIGICNQAVKFSPSGITPGATVSLECLETGSSTPTTDAGATP